MSAGSDPSSADLEALGVEARSIRAVIGRLHERRRLRAKAASIASGLVASTTGAATAAARLSLLDSGHTCTKSGAVFDCADFNCLSQNNEPFNCAGTYSNCGGAQYEFICASEHVCTGDKIYDCYEFGCGTRNADGFECDRDYDFNCGSYYECYANNDCESGHIFSCTSDFSCYQRNACSATGIPPCSGNYSRDGGGDTTAGDFVCGWDPAVSTDSFSCNEFGCIADDEFDCTGDTDFSCYGSFGGCYGGTTFHCDGTTNAFECAQGHYSK